MPYRSRKRRRYGKKKVGKRRGKKYSRKLRKFKSKRKYKRRYGKRSRVSKLNKNALATATKYTTLYKTAIRVTSKTGTCNFVSLSSDNAGCKFSNGVKTNYNGDMSFYGLSDIQECLRTVQQQHTMRVQGEVADEAKFHDTGLRDSANLTVPLAGVEGGKWKTALNWVNDNNQQVYCGKHSYQLSIKSAITGANCSVTLYKVKARYNLPNVSWQESGRDGSAYVYASAGWAATSNTQVTGNNLMNYFYDVNALLNRLWINKMNTNSIIGNSSFSNDSWAGHQEGTTLYDNTEFLKLFKIVKTYNFELLPGQSANLKLKNKYIKKMNPIQLALNQSYFAVKGQVFFIMKLQGAVGHEAQANTQSAKFFGGAESRPSIGLMPAAVDVMCMKKLNCWVDVTKKAPKIRNIIKVADYQDDNNTEALGPGQFRDCAPSDYNDSAAILF